MLRPRTVLVTLVVAGFGVAGAIAAFGPRSAAKIVIPTADVRTTTSTGPATRTAVGMSGCLAAACHGAPAGKALKGDLADVWQCSGSVWAAADPHTAAYSLLTDSPRRSVKVTADAIMAKYAPGRKATEDARCVACHTNPALASSEAMAEPKYVALREQGVSCEACHGNAGAWIQPHTAWKDDRTKFYADAGMTPLHDLGERAMNCAGCHVGAPAEGGLPVRDMNHDMIAAGHPRLNFDFAEYQRRLPKHWQEKNRTLKGTPTVEVNEAKVWYVGRVAHAEAACKLLADRAARAEAGDKRSPWPEFAEFNCASCHHNLRVPNERDKHGDWRKSAEYLDGRPPGNPAWQTIWPLTHAPGVATPKRGASNLTSVVRLMEGDTGNTRDAPAADCARHGGTRRRGVDGVATLARRETGRGGRAGRTGVLPPGAPLVPEWDSATQLFFGLAALEYSRGKPGDATVKNYQVGVSAFRKQEWGGVETAFDLIRPK